MPNLVVNTVPQGKPGRGGGGGRNSTSNNQYKALHCNFVMLLQLKINNESFLFSTF